VAATSSQASLVSSLDTGAGQYANNQVAHAPLTDPNWTVSLLSANQTPPGILTGKAYLVPNDIGFPIPPWLANSLTSTWITYSQPTQVNGDNTGGTYQYQTSFSADQSGTIGINYASDNNGYLYINGTQYSDNGSSESTFEQWTTYNLSVTAGHVYTVDLDVYNQPQGNGNPTGANVQFTGTGVDVTPVPEASTVLAGALMLLPFGVSTLRIMRRRKMA